MFSLARGYKNARRQVYQGTKGAKAIRYAATVNAILRHVKKLQASYRTQVPEAKFLSFQYNKRRRKNLSLLLDHLLSHPPVTALILN
jgi:hypothetical protein